MHHISYDIYHISPNVFSHHHKNLHQHHDPSQRHEDHHSVPPSQGVFTLTQTVHSNVSIFSPEDAMCCSDDPPLRYESTATGNPLREKALFYNRCLQQHVLDFIHRNHNLLTLTHEAFEILVKLI